MFGRSWTVRLRRQVPRAANAVKRVSRSTLSPWNAKDKLDGSMQHRSTARENPRTTALQFVLSLSDSTRQPMPDTSSLMPRPLLAAAVSYTHLTLPTIRLV